MASLRYCLVFFIAVCAHISLTQSKSQLIQLDEVNWEKMLTGEWMVEFYAPWCPACKALQPLWEDFSSWSKDLDLSVAQVDVTKSPGLSGRFLVTALPTIFHVINGEFRQYKGARDKDSLIAFIDENKWKAVEPIPSWKSPSSFQMSVVSYLFKMSQVLRSIHNKLMDDYGLPSWASYVVFALVTILLGSVLGLMMVCCIDFLYPPRKVPSVTITHDEKTEKEETEDELGNEDEIVDDQAQEANEDNSVRKRKPRKAD